MLLPAVNSLIFGPVVDSGNVGVVVPIAVLLASVTCARCSSAARRLVMSRVGTKLKPVGASRCMMRTLSLPAPFYRAYASGDLSARLSSIETLASMLQNIVLTTGLTSVFSLAYVAQIAAYARFGLACAGRDPGQRGSVGGVRAGAGERDQAQAGALRARKGWEYALFTGIQKIRLTGAERRAYATWVDSYKDEVKLTYNGPRLMRYSNVVQTAVSVVGTIVIYFTAVQTGVSTSEYMAFNLAYGMATGAFMSLAGVAGNFASIKPHLDMAAPIMKSVPESAGGQAGA